ncbi:hypothetical protein M514_05240 [Trichuris suis]|uniref:Uncharacterized protein n=1 Tax=Trichuris suis TaxID=68888 RepID=A0A085ND15_9BILA|nr:hypothetical protein M513_05240 [Trichuris suis]KFD67361.1 hypothetical protein M514_05240 [Trichuris suis]
MTAKNEPRDYWLLIRYDVMLIGNKKKASMLSGSTSRTQSFDVQAYLVLLRNWCWSSAIKRVVRTGYKDQGFQIVNEEEYQIHDRALTAEELRLIGEQRSSFLGAESTRGSVNVK